MTLSIVIARDVEARLRERASREGLDPEEFAKRIIEQVVRQANIHDALAPFRKQVAESGITDAQLDTSFEGLVRDARSGTRCFDERPNDTPSI